MDEYVPQDEQYLWYLADPGAPRLVGSLRLVQRSGDRPGGVSLTYADSWLAGGFPLSEDLPLHAGEFFPSEKDDAVGAVNDARPDRWGERVIRFLDRPARLSTLEFLYFAGDERFGALGVSLSDTRYAPRPRGALATLDDVQGLHDLVRQIEQGGAADPRLRRLLLPGTLGGARPKALVEIDGVQWVLKFSEAGDEFDTPLIEHAAMTLAAAAGISVCETLAIKLSKCHAVAVRRFDRAGSERLHASTAAVALKAAGVEYGYPELALLLRRRGESAAISANGEEVFRRMVFNILIDNSDDHEKNHALLSGGDRAFRLAPAYDVLPTAQSLGYQSMKVGADGAESTLANALSERRSFMISLARAQEICKDVATTVDRWATHFTRSGVSAKDLELLAPHIDRGSLSSQRRDAMKGVIPRGRG